MTLFSLALASFRIALIVIPFVAIEQTSTNDLAEYTLFVLWAIQLLKGIGYDVIEHEYGWEMNLYFSLILGCKTAYSVKQEWASVYWWGVVVVLELMFTFGKRLKWFKLYLDEWRYTQADKEALYRKEHDAGWFSRSLEQIQRDTLKEVSIVNLVILTSVITLFNILRCLMQYLEGYDGNVDWYANENVLMHTNLSLYMTMAESAVMILVCVRVPSLYTTNQMNFILDFSGVFLLYLFMNLTQIWLVDLYGIIVLALQAFFTLLVLFRCQKQMQPIPGGNTNAMLVAIKEIVFVLMGMLTSTPAGLLNYLIGSGIVIFSLNQEIFRSKVEFTPDLRDLTCIPYDVVNLYVKQFYDVTTSSEYAPLFQVIALEFSRIRLQLTAFLIKVYPVLRLACLGPTKTVVPFNDYLTLAIAILPCFPSLFIFGCAFPEAQRIIRRPSFWAVAVVLCLVSLIGVQLASDTSVSFWYLVIQSEYQRDYTIVGLGLIATQILLLITAIIQWHNRSLDDKERKAVHAQTSTSGSVSNAIDWGKKFTSTFTKPSVVLILLATAFTIYQLTLTSPIKTIEIRSIVVEDTPYFIRSSNSTEDLITSKVLTLGFLINSKFRVVTGVLGIAQFMASQIPNSCIADVCLSDLLGNMLLLFQNLLNQVVDLVGEALVEAMEFIAAFKPVVDMLRRITAVASVQSFQLFSQLNWGIEIFRIPPWLKYATGALVVVSLIISIIGLWYAASVYIELAKKLITALIASAVTVLLGYVVNAYMLLLSFGYEVYIEWEVANAFQFAIGVVVFLIGVAFMMFAGDEDAYEKIEATKTSGRSTYQSLRRNRPHA